MYFTHLQDQMRTVCEADILGDPLVVMNTLSIVMKTLLIVIMQTSH